MENEIIIQLDLLQQGKYLEIFNLVTNTLLVLKSYQVEINEIDFMNNENGIGVFFFAKGNKSNCFYFLGVSFNLLMLGKSEFLFSLAKHGGKLTNLISSSNKQFDIFYNRENYRERWNYIRFDNNYFTSLFTERLEDLQKHLNSEVIEVFKALGVI